MCCACTRRGAEAIDIHDPAAVERLGRIVIEAAGMPRDWLLSGPAGEQVLLASEPIVAVREPLMAVGLLRAGLGRGVALLPDLYGEKQVAEGTLNGLSIRRRGTRRARGA